MPFLAKKGELEMSKKVQKIMLNFVGHGGLIALVIVIGLIAVVRTYYKQAQLEKDPLEKLVEQREKKAEKKQLYEKSDLILDYLAGRRNESSGNWVPSDLYVSGSLKIVRSYDIILSAISIVYNDQQVFVGGAYVLAYIPGEWEVELNKLYDQAKKVEKEVKEANHQEYRKTRMEAFGLTEEDLASSQSEN